MSQPFGLSCKGGLNTNLNQFEMLANPGMATELQNFEVDPDGGYRRINGYRLLGESSGTRPNGANPILGIHPYALGIVVCVGTSVYYTEDGITWLQVNYDTGTSGVSEATLTTLTELDRPNQTQAQFVTIKGVTSHATNPYGIVTIATGADQVANFEIDDTGASRTYRYAEVSTPAAGKYVEHLSRHLCVVDATNEPNTVYFSATNTNDDFAGIGSGSVVLTDVITGIKAFRDSLYIFCENTIHRLDNINDSATLQVVQITNNVGCLSGHSIQEIGGDLMFLAPDGVRTVAATERIDDVELSSVSRQIQSIITNIARNKDTLIISSAVLRSRSQYRLFYSEAGGSVATSKGIIGTLTGKGFEWSETIGIQAPAFASGYDGLGIERAYHGDTNGYIYSHDSGDYFDPAGVQTNISAKYTTPFLDFGDAGTRKTLKYARVSMSPEGEVSPYLRVKYDFGLTDTPQPAAYSLSGLYVPAIFGASIFGNTVFGGVANPFVRRTIEGSGYTASFMIYSNSANPPYSINGLYIDYVPSGRR